MKDGKFRRSVSMETLSAIFTAVEEYEAAVEGSSLDPTDKRAYVEQMRLFVRWLKCDFEPGDT